MNDLPRKELVYIPLAQHFLAKFAEELAKPITDFAPAVLHQLQAYEWPGNVRELEHVIERAVALTEHATISEAEVTLTTPPPMPRRATFHKAKAHAVAQFEQTYLKEILMAYGGNITQAARAAGKNRRAFWQLLRKHGLEGRSVQTSPLPDLDNC